MHEIVRRTVAHPARSIIEQFWVIREFSTEMFYRIAKPHTLHVFKAFLVPAFPEKRKIKKGQKRDIDPSSDTDQCLD